MKLSLALLAAMTASFALACGDAAAPAIDEQAPITSESDLSKATFTRLDQASSDEVVDAFYAMFDTQLGEVLAAHRDIKTITKTNLSRLTVVGVMSYIDLADAIEMMLDAKGQASAKPSALLAYARPWAKATLAPHVKADGKVDFKGVDPLMIYRSVKAAEEKASIANAEKARGVDLEKLVTQWREVEAEGGMLDSAFLHPVKVDREPSISEVSRHFGYRFSLTSWGYKAVDDMGSAHEGPNGSPTFKPIAQTLKNATGIKKRFFSQGGGDEWSRNVLVVLDEKNQLWGFMMGYSE